MLMRLVSPGNCRPETLYDFAELMTASDRLIVLVKSNNRYRWLILTSHLFFQAGFVVLSFRYLDKLTILLSVYICQLFLVWVAMLLLNHFAIMVRGLTLGTISHRIQLCHMERNCGARVIKWNNYWVYRLRPSLVSGTVIRYFGLVVGVALVGARG